MLSNAQPVDVVNATKHTPRMTHAHNPHQLPADLPVPVDDGAAAHLQGMRLPALMLACTDGTRVDLQRLPARTVLFFYPRTGVPGQRPSNGFHGETWESIAGARGCTPQNCGYRDLHAEFAALDVTVLGVSTQDTAHQQAFRQRNHVPFHSISDVDLQLVHAMRLPTFEFPVESGGPNTLIRRMSWFVENGVISRCWYPVFPPDQDASTVLQHLRTCSPPPR